MDDTSEGDGFLPCSFLRRESSELWMAKGKQNANQEEPAESTTVCWATGQQFQWIITEAGKYIPIPLCWPTEMLSFVLVDNIILTHLTHSN